MKSKKKIAIYTSGNSHHELLSVLVDYFNLKKCDFSILVIDYERFDRVVNGRFANNIKGKYINPFDSKKSVLFKLINLFIYLFNGLKISYFLHSESYSDVIALDSELILNLMIPLSFKSETQFSIILHNIDEYMTRDLFRLNPLKPQEFKMFYANYFDKYIVIDVFTIYNSLKLKTEKPLFSIGYSYSTQEDIDSRNEFISSKIFSQKKPLFLVIGSVENVRKNYYQIIDLFVGISHKSYYLTFLGKVIDRDVIVYSNNKGVIVNYFENYLSVNDFEKIILDSHFILYIPPVSNSDYQFKKATGSFFDGPKYGIPVLTNFKEINHPRGHFVVSEKLDKLINEITFNFNINAYLKDYGIPAFKKMELNTLIHNLKDIDII